VNCFRELGFHAASWAFAFSGVCAKNLGVSGILAIWI
jgi:hypothetical protein